MENRVEPIDLFRRIEDKSKIIKALGNFYMFFLTKKARTLSNWCRLEEIHYDIVIDYMVVNTMMPSLIIWLLMALVCQKPRKMLLDI
jgi:hypothetical protein